MYWKNKSRHVINTVLVQFDNEPVNHEQLIKLVRECYPFGLRSHHPYKVWLNEVKNLRSFLSTKQSFKNYLAYCEILDRTVTVRSQAPTVPKGQLSLLEQTDV